MLKKHEQWAAIHCSDLLHEVYDSTPEFDQYDDLQNYDEFILGLQMTITDHDAMIKALSDLGFTNADNTFNQWSEERGLWIIVPYYVQVPAGTSNLVVKKRYLITPIGINLIGKVCQHIQNYA